MESALVLWKGAGVCLESELVEAVWV